MTKTLTMTVVCYHTPQAQLSTALQSAIVAMQELLNNDASWNFQISIVDNSEHAEFDVVMFDQFLAELNSVSCELRLIKGQGNVGYGTAQNLGLQRRTSTFHLIMNPDVIMDPDSLHEGVCFLQDNREVAIASPYATDADGNKQFLCKRYPSVSILFLRGFMPNVIRSLFTKSLAHYEMQDLQEHPERNIPIVSGCFMLCRTEVLLEVAGFNEDFFLYFEDFDLSMRVSEKYSLAYVPAMKIIHHGGNASRKGPRHIGMFLKSAIRFFNIYGWRLF